MAHTIFLGLFKGLSGIQAVGVTEIRRRNANQGEVMDFPQSSSGQALPLEKTSALFNRTPDAPIITGKGRLLVVEHFPHLILCILARLRGHVFKNQRSNGEMDLMTFQWHRQH